VSLRVELEGLWAGERALVRGLAFEVGAGAAATLMGPSGAGKSSVLAWMTGTLPPALRGAGRVWAGGEEMTGLPPHRRRLGILFQDDLLFPHMSVGENLLFGLDPGVRGRDRRAAVEAALAGAELGGFAGRRPESLSGGQRARVALLRVLLSRPRALLLDEPFAGLDAALRGRFRALVLERARMERLPVLLVTHDAADAAGAVLQPWAA